MAQLAQPSSPPAAAASALHVSDFPNIGVSLNFLISIAESPDLDIPMYQLARPDLTEQKINAMDNSTLRQLAKELRVHSNLNGTEEFALYDDITTDDQEWRNAISNPPTTTTHINLCIVKPRTKGTGACYAESIIRPSHPKWVGTPTDFLSHAWRYNFKALVHATKSEAEERDRSRAKKNLPPIADQRFYWNDIFVEDQNATDSKPEGYFFNAFRDAVTSIGRTVLILMPLKDAIPLTRAWCVWEMFCSIQASNVELCVALPPSEKLELERMLHEEFDMIINILINVKVEKSEAFIESDRNEIHRIIREQCGGGFSGVDDVLCGGLRSWLEKTGSSLLADAKEGEEDAKTLTLMDRVATMLREQGRQEEAEGWYRRGLAGRERVLGPEHSDTLATLNNLGLVLYDRYQLEEAEAIYRRGLEVKERVLGSEHPDTLASLNHLAALIGEDSARLEEAEVMHRRALEGQEEVLGVEHPDTLRSLNELGHLLQERGQLEEAEIMSRRALEIKERVLGPEHPETLTSIHIISCLLRKQGNLPEALVFACRALDSRTKVLGDEHPGALGSMYTIASILEKQGDFIQAERYARRSLDGYLKLNLTDDVEDGVAQIAGILRAQEKNDEAEALECRYA